MLPCVAVISGVLGLAAPAAVWVVVEELSVLALLRVVVDLAHRADLVQLPVLADLLVEAEEVPLEVIPRSHSAAMAGSSTSPEIQRFGAVPRSRQ